MGQKIGKTSKSAKYQDLKKGHITTEHFQRHLSEKQPKFGEVLACYFLKIY